MRRLPGEIMVATFDAAAAERGWTLAERRAMYIIIPVLVSRAFGEAEAREAGVEPGKERTPEEIEFELEKLLAPYDASTRLEIARRSPGRRAERVRVPNYGARFDFWQPDGDFLGTVGDGEKGSRVEHEIYASAGGRGHGVIAADGLRKDFFYDALVTPDGRYHDFSPSEPPEEATARREALLREHSGCLAFVCKAHI